MRIYTNDSFVNEHIYFNLDISIKEFNHLHKNGNGADSSTDVDSLNNDEIYKPDNVFFSTYDENYDFNDELQYFN